MVCMLSHRLSCVPHTRCDRHFQVFRQWLLSLYLLYYKGARRWRHNRFARVPYEDAFHVPSPLRNWKRWWGHPCNTREGKESKPISVHAHQWLIPNELVLFSVHYIYIAPARPALQGWRSGVSKGNENVGLMCKHNDVSSAESYLHHHHYQWMTIINAPITDKTVILCRHCKQWGR